MSTATVDPSVEMIQSYLNLEFQMKRMNRIKIRQPLDLGARNFQVQEIVWIRDTELPAQDTWTILRSGTGRRRE